MLAEKSVANSWKSNQTGGWIWDTSNIFCCRNSLEARLDKPWVTVIIKLIEKAKNLISMPHYIYLNVEKLYGQYLIKISVGFRAWYKIIILRSSKQMLHQYCKKKVMITDAWNTFPVFTTSCIPLMWQLMWPSSSQRWKIWRRTTVSALSNSRRLEKVSS